MGPADVSVGNQKFNFPEPDLLRKLLDAYFTHVHPFSPLLHRPTFEKAVAEDHHLTDAGFGSVVLLVCAIGARDVNDPRVLLEDAWSHSAGWKWFNQVQMVRKSLLAPPRLYDLQIYCVSFPSISTILLVADVSGMRSSYLPSSFTVLRPLKRAGR
jgi:hypothetical protein